MTLPQNLWSRFIILNQAEFGQGEVNENRSSIELILYELADILLEEDEIIKNSSLAEGRMRESKKGKSSLC